MIEQEDIAGDPENLTICRFAAQDDRWIVHIIPYFIRAEERWSQNEFSTLCFRADQPRRASV